MKRRQPNAATVSRVLREAGYPRATEYQVFASRDQHGYMVTWPYGPSVHVNDSRSMNRAAGRPVLDARAADVEAYAATLTAAGYNVRIDRGPESGYPYSVWVEPWPTEEG